MKDRSLIRECRRTRTEGAKGRPCRKLDQMGRGPSLHNILVAVAMKKGGHSGRTMARRHEQKVKRE